MIIDAHMHLFRNGYTGFTGPSPLGGSSDVDAYERLAARRGIDAALVVCYEEQIDPGNNGYVRELASSRPWISSVAYMPNQTPPSLLLTDGLLKLGHLGVSLYLPDVAAVERVLRWPRAFWDRLDRSHALVSLNAPPEAIAQMAPLFERGPNCSFLISHLGLPGRFEHMPSRVEAAARLAPLLRFASHANVGVKISGLYAIDPAPPHHGAKPFIELLLERFSTTSLYWGSDYSPVLEFSSLEGTLALGTLCQLAPDDQALIVGEALARRISLARQSR